MKKFYFALMAMLVSLCASATDYYLIGGFNGWALKQASCKFTDQGDGTYVLDYNGKLSSGFKINDGTWGPVDLGNNGAQIELGKVYTLKNKGGNIETKDNSDFVNPHIVLNPTAMTLLITGQEEEVELEFGVKGSFTNSNWDIKRMTKKGDKWEIADLAVTYSSAQFGVLSMPKGSDNQIGWFNSNGDINITTAGGTLPCVPEIYGSTTNYNIAKGTYTIVYDPAANTIEVTGEGGGGDDPIPPTPTTYTGWYLNVQGDFNNYQPVGVAFSADGKAESKNLEIGTSSFELKIWDGTADSYWGTSSTVVPGEAVEVAKGGPKMTISGAAAGDVYNVAFDAATSMMTVTKVGGGDDPIVDTHVYALHGQITGNEAWETVPMTKNEDTGNWEYTGAIVAGEFGMFCDGSWMRGGGITVTEANYAYSFTGNANSKNELEGNYTIEYNPTAKTLTFIPREDIEEVITYAIRGNFVTGEWADYALTEEEGKWVTELAVVPGEFGVKKMVNGAQSIWYAAPTAESAAIDAVGTFEAGDDGTTNWALSLEGEYKFVFDPEAMTLVVTYTSGVEAVEAAEAVEAVYYNLQGVRVANPANGLYIRVAGQKASKVYVK